MKKILSTIRGSVACLILGLNTVFAGGLIVLLGLIRWVLPIPRVKQWLAGVLVSIAETWISVNNFILNTDTGLNIEVHMDADLDRNARYIVNSNHQSWADILILQYVFNRKAPFLRFFLKKNLIWVPIIGFAWWALDFPFMRRYSKAEIKRKPELKGKDLETARRACEKFRRVPVSMMNFLEGTRFTETKRASQGVSYQHLLKPRLGGLSQIIQAFEGRLTGLLDVTIIYPERTASFWELLSGQVNQVIVDVRSLPIPASFNGRDFRTDKEYKAELSDWSHAIWQRKDQLISAHLAKTAERVGS